MKEKDNISLTVSIQAKPEDVFKVLTQVERWHLWTTSVNKIEITDTGVFGHGSKARISQPDQEPVMWTVTQYEPGRSFTWVHEAFGCSVKSEYLVEPGQNGARVKRITTFEGGLTSYFFKPFKRLFKKNMIMEMEGLKKECEKVSVEEADKV